MARRISKFAASLALFVGMGMLLPPLPRINIQHPSVLYALAYFEALAGKTDCAVTLARRAAEQKNAAGTPAAAHVSAAHRCPQTGSI